MKKIKKEVKEIEVIKVEETGSPTVVKSIVIEKILPITQEFGNGDMNALRDKINEIIKSL